MNSRQHATENIKTTNARPALKHVTSSLGSKTAANMSGDPWTPEKEKQSSCGKMETFPCLFDTSCQEYSILNKYVATSFDQN